MECLKTRQTVTLHSFARLLSVTIVVLCCYKVMSQEMTNNVNVSFGIQKWDPVHVKVDEKTGSASSFSNPIRFTAVNSTYYPFMLSIDFVQFENLSPRPAQRPVEVSHGSNNLYTFSVQVPGKGYAYRYSYSYWLKPADKDLDEAFPYLVPLSEGTVVNSKRSVTGRVNNSFAGNSGDTVYCMRRGIVTAVPRSETMDFRISEHDCLEVLHEDGTYMIYHYLNKSDSFTAPGKIVLPGQPIGRISDSCYVLVTLMRIEGSGNVMSYQPISYAVTKSKTASFDEIDGIEKSVFPREVMIKELKGKEIKQLQKSR